MNIVYVLELYHHRIKDHTETKQGMSIIDILESYGHGIKRPPCGQPRDCAHRGADHNFDGANIT
jgi:hypothetical protein